jgi:signal transduction histidine kinase
MCFSLGSASVLFLALNAPSITANAAQLEPWWPVAFVTLFAGSAVFLCGVSLRLPAALLLRACAAHALVFAVGLAMVPVAQTVRFAEAPWVFNLAVLGAAAAGVALGKRAGWAYLAAVASLLFWIAAAADESPFATFFHAALLNTFFMTLFFCIARATWRAGRLLDEAAESAIREARSAATTAARAAEDVRIQALVHDSVLVALLAFARSSGTSTDPRAAIQARRALDAMQSLEIASPLHPASSAQLLQTLQSLATEVAPDAVFVQNVDTNTLIVPADAVQAFSEALAEALRNSITHAAQPGVAVGRRIDAEVTPHSVTVVVSDHGQGFDPDHISPDRLGIRVGVIERMERLPGGGASVESRPGHGTRVHLNWWVG